MGLPDFLNPFVGSGSCALSAMQVASGLASHGRSFAGLALPVLGSASRRIGEISGRIPIFQPAAILKVHLSSPFRHPWGEAQHHPEFLGFFRAKWAPVHIGVLPSLLPAPRAHGFRDSFAFDSPIERTLARRAYEL